jgi:hypothetical protein
MAFVYPMLRRHIACFQTVCTLLEEHVYNPIMAGRALHLGKIDQSISGSLMQKIEGAVIPPRPVDGDGNVEQDGDDTDMPDRSSTGEEDEDEDEDGSDQDHLADKQESANNDHDEALSDDSDDFSDSGDEKEAVDDSDEGSGENPR